MAPRKQAKTKKLLTIQQVASMGGRATARKLTANERSKVAQRAARARWSKAKKKKAG